MLPEENKKNAQRRHRWKSLFCEEKKMYEVEESSVSQNKVRSTQLHLQSPETSSASLAR